MASSTKKYMQNCKLWSNEDFMIGLGQLFENFVRDLSVEELFGVGKVTAEKLHSRGLKTCSDLQKMTLSELKKSFWEIWRSIIRTKSWH